MHGELSCRTEGAGATGEVLPGGEFRRGGTVSHGLIEEGRHEGGDVGVGPHRELFFPGYTFS